MKCWKYSLHLCVEPASWKCIHKFCVINQNLKPPCMQNSKLTLLFIILCFLFSWQNLPPPHPRGEESEQMFPIDGCLWKEQTLFPPPQLGARLGPLGLFHSL